MRQTFSKPERLCSKKILGDLFKKGSTTVQPGVAQTFYLFPFRVLYLPASPLPNGEPTLPAIVITVPKRIFKRAVDRNHIRRRVREAYRLHKSLLIGSGDVARPAPAYIAFLYTAKQIISFEEIEKGMKLAFKQLAVNSPGGATGPNRR